MTPGKHLLPLLLLWIALPSCSSKPDTRSDSDAQSTLLDPDLESGRVVQKKSRYRVIADEFEKATDAPNVNEFDPLDIPRVLTRCYGVKFADPDGMMEMVIRQMEVEYKGTPSFGPLFPGVPDRKTTSLVIGMANGWVNGANLTPEKRQVFELHPMGGTLVIRINENEFGIYQDFGNPAEIWLRKGKNGHIFYKVFKLGQDEDRVEAFVGYCFKK
ncbi:MAG: hypothetical protein EBX52_08275 [Proteobacteria bacterium]|nr:hypothetical protein [Pseudomonadota bacterium]